jgi:DNA repair exonuclease SbcCD ATPase subunit
MEQCRSQEIKQRHEEFKVEKERQIKELLQQKDQAIDYLKEQIQSHNEKNRQDMHEIRVLMEEQRHQWLVKEDGLKTEKSRLEKSIKKMEGIEQQSQHLVMELKQQLKLREAELQGVRSDNKTILDKLLMSEKALSVSEISLFENKQWRETFKEERDVLEQTLRREREMIGCLEERLRQIEFYQSQDLVKES